MKKILLSLLIFLPATVYAQNIHNVLTRAGQANQCYWDDTNTRLLLNGGGAGTPTTPTLSFGDGDSGLYENIDDSLQLSLGGVTRWEFVASTFGSTTSGAAQLLQSAASNIVPAAVPL